MPADLDGNALPPSAAPGIFASLHNDGIYVYRMRVTFGTSSASRTLQAIVPIAPANAACGGGTCIPQPGTSMLLDGIGDRRVGALAGYEEALAGLDRPLPEQGAAPEAVIEELAASVGPATVASHSMRVAKVRSSSQGVRKPGVWAP